MLNLLAILTNRWVQYGLAAVAAGGLFLWWLHSREQAAVAAAMAAMAVAAARKAKHADEAAVGKSEAIKDEVEKANAKARDEAAGSDDPLRAALDSLRNR